MNRLLAHPVRVLAVVVAAGIGLAGCGAQAHASDVDRAPAAFSTAAPTVESDVLVLDGIRHRLAHRAQPRPGYVTRAYLPAGQRPASYERMLLVEVVAGASVPDAVRTQVDLLQRRKATDPLVNLDLRTNPRSGEAVLDFTMSGRAADGRPIVEWNVYRYVPITQHGVRGVQLYGLSLRAYGTDRLAFARNLSETQPREIAAVSAVRVPRVALPVG